MIEVIGGENVGAKAGMLRDHESAIYEVGLGIPPTTIIASETVNATQFTSPNRPTIKALGFVSKKYHNTTALAIRSSADGDAEGNGVYESRFSANTPELVIQEAELVIGSFSTESARDFRRQARLGDEFALMVQPVVGQDLGSTEYWEQFGPYLSGFGYSSSLKHPDGYINVVAGIGGGVDRPGGQIVTPKDLEDTPNFYEFLESVYDRVENGEIDDVPSDFRRSDDGCYCEELVKHGPASARYLTRKAGASQYTVDKSGLLSAGIEEDTGKTDWRDWPIKRFIESDFVGATRKFMPNKLLEAMREIERIAGYPVYLEWALETSGNAIRPIILQVAPAEQTPRHKIEQQIEGRVVADVRNIIGHGIKKASKIIALGSTDDVRHLREFNRDPANEGYILMFTSQIASSMSKRQLEYADCSKAGVLIEIQTEDDTFWHEHGDIAQHLLGSARQTDKFIGEVQTSSRSHIEPLWQRIHAQGTSWQSDRSTSLSSYIQILDGKFTVYADETTGRLVIADDSK